ncbi:Glutamate receptor interacting protein [Carabus blaptoides fortunei]
MKRVIASDRMKDKYDVKQGTVGLRSEIWSGLYNPRRRLGFSPKLQRPWEGPYTVVKRINDVIYRIRKLLKGKPKIMHVNQLKCRSPTLSDDSGKHSAPSVHSETLSHGIALSYGAGTRDTAVTVVELRKNKGEPLGIVLATGPSDLGTCPSIASFKAGSTAQRSDQLAPGDRVRSVNGINTARMRPEELGSLLDNVLGETATLEVEYTLPDYSSQGSLCVTSKVTSVTLERVDGSLGITMRGGMHATDPMLSKPLVVTHVRPHGPAHRSGRIKVGDRLLKVDSHSLANKTPLEAQQLLKQPNDCSKIGQLGSSLSTLTIEYDVSIMESVKYATGPLLVEIERHMNEDLGLILSNCCDFGPDEIMSAGIYIESIIPASIADRCGALHVGDQILAVDDTYLEGSSATPQEVTWLLQNYNNTQNCTQLQIMPYHSLANGSNNSGGPGQCGWIERGIGPPSSPSISGFSTINSRKSRSRQRYGRNSTVPKSFDVDNANCIVTNANTPTGYGSRLGVCHVETLTVVLQPDEQAGYGLLVNTDGAAGDQQQANIIITHINQDSPAYRCGCLQVGDRIISINGQCSLTVQEVRALLELGNSSTGSRLIVQTEFDVADTVVPASGVFTVKLAKSGPDLGITITASKTIPDDPFLISDIRRGSAAHRTGTLHIGDHVLAIDNRQLDHVGLDAAFEMVQNSQSDIVTLRIQKGDEMERQTAVAEQPEEIVYTVELNRRGGPLGITVSGSEDRSEPIVLSALTQGGLAEKTGALHVGDRILAINGETLEKRPLSDAIRLLQTSGDKVQLKIARQIKNGTDGDSYPIFQEPRGNYSSPGLASIDSAVESWDSGVIESSNSDSQTNKDTSFDCKKPDVIQHSIPDEVQSQYSLKKHESQLLFYSDVEDSICPSPLPLPNYNFTNTLQSKYDSSYFFCSKPSLSSRNDFRYHKDMDAYSETTTPDLEIHHVTLHKDSVYDDYGFSVSDGLYEKGVYINRIRRGGPAHLAGMLRPYDRILQVNDTRTKDFDCCLTVPLIASAGDKIELIIARNPYIGCPEEKDIHVLSWTPDEPDPPRISTNSFSSSQNTITKTL